MTNEEWFPTEEQVEEYLLLQKMLQTQKSEFDLLSRKKSNEQLNPFKIKMVNRVLEPLKEIFQNEDYVNFLDILDEDDMPTNSDVVLVLSQYQTAVHEFRSRYYRKDLYVSDYRWMTQENPPEDEEDDYEEDEEDEE